MPPTVLRACSSRAFASRILRWYSSQSSISASLLQASTSLVESGLGFTLAAGAGVACEDSARWRHSSDWWSSCHGSAVWPAGPQQGRNPADAILSVPLIQCGTGKKLVFIMVFALLLTS